MGADNVIRHSAQPLLSQVWRLPQGIDCTIELLLRGTGNLATYVRACCGLARLILRTQVAADATNVNRAGKRNKT